MIIMKSIDYKYHINIPTLALLNNLSFILYPVCMVVATLLTVNPGGHGIVNKLSEVLGSNGLFVGSNS